MVGEIRDGETANLAVQAALTGHLVLATLHTNSSSGAVPRLLDMGIESFLLSSTMNAVLAQRLVRKICPFCKEKYEAPDTVVKNIKTILGGYFNEGLISINKAVPMPDKSDEKAEAEAAEEFEKKLTELELRRDDKPSEKLDKVNLFRGKGCDKCNNTGYKGRVGIYEVLDVTDKIASLITKRATSAEIEAVGCENGMITLIQDG